MSFHPAKFEWLNWTRGRTWKVRIGVISFQRKGRQGKEESFKQREHMFCDLRSEPGQIMVAEKCLLVITLRAFRSQDNLSSKIIKVVHGNKAQHQNRCSMKVPVRKFCWSVQYGGQERTCG
jgi:hypothetical protein